MTIRKFYTFRVNDSTPEDHVGRFGEITYRDGFLYYHDGSTPGGEVIGGGGGSGGPTSWASVTGKPTFAAVATSGAYADLTGKPTIPSNVSDLTNDSGFITSVTWADVSGKPNLFSGAYADLTGKPALFSGSYTDLTNKPTIPSLTGYATEAWVNEQGFGSGTFTGNYNDLTNKPVISDTTNLVGGDFFIAKDATTLVLGQWAAQTISFGENGIFVGGSGGVTLQGAAGASIQLGGGTSGNIVFASGTSGINYNDLSNTPTIPSLDGYATESWVNSQNFGSGSGSGATTLNGLTDVALEEPSQGQVLTWNNNQSKWENQGLPSINEITSFNAETMDTYSVSVSTSGIVTMTTARGSLEFGAQPEEGAPQHLHIMRPADQGGATDLYFGDDYNYVKLPGNYGAGTLGVEIGAKDAGDGGQSVWRFGTDGNIHLPAGGNILDSNSNSVLGGGGASGFTKAVVAGQNDILAEESGNELTLVAGDGIAITTNENDGTVTISAASNATPQYGYFSELVETSSSNQVNGQAVVMDSDGNSYVSFIYWDDNQGRDIGGMAKYSSTGEQLWAVNLASQNPDARELQIVSLEYVTIDGDPSLIALGHYYDNNTNKDVAFMFYVNPMTGSVGEPLVDAELVATSGMNVRDGVAGYDGSNTYSVVVGETYDQTLVKTLTPLAGSTTDKLYVSWADFAASGVNTGEGVNYVDGPNSYGVTMNAVGVSASVAGSSDPSWAGISITVSKTEAGNYTITNTNGWGYLVNGWSNPVTLTVPGSALGGVDSVNDLTFDFSNVIFNNNSSNIQAAISNIQGTPPAGVYCPGWGGFDWGTQVGNTLNFNYQLNNQAYIGRFGQSGTWTKNFGGGSYDRLNSVVVDSDLNTYAVGYVWSGSRGSLVAKYDIEGGPVWAVYIDPPDNTGNELKSVDLLSDGNVITVDEDGIVTKLNKTDGSILWQVKADNDPSWDGDFRGTATPDGDYIITNYEDNDYTQYVMRISGVDGSSVWSKRISRTHGGDNGEMQADDDAQYIDCNATHLTIAGRTDPPNGNTTGIVYNFPINGENTDGTYGQYVISSESMNWTTLSTTSIAAAVTNTDISVTVNSVGPTSGSTYVTTSTVTTMGGEPVVEPTVIEWTNPNDNVWRIEDYNGGASVSYDGDNYDAKWFDIANHTSGSSNFRGAIIQYHAFIGNQGTMIGTIHLATDYNQEGATHTEHISGNSDLQFVTLWDCNNNDGQLYFKMTNGNSGNLLIQWTAKVFYGQEYND